MRPASFSTLPSLAVAFLLATPAAFCQEDAPRQIVAAWLKEQPSLRMATITDCGECAEDLEAIRSDSSAAWPGVADYDPYFLVADCNGDGVSDVAVVLFDTLRRASPFVVAIFNGPLQLGHAKPAFLKRHLDLRGGGLFYGPPRPRPYRLVVGGFDSEGSIVEPIGATYRWR